MIYKIFANKNLLIEFIIKLYFYYINKKIIIIKFSI